MTTLPRPPTPIAEPVAEGAPMREALRAVREVAPAPTTVLLVGEPGTGRTHLARLLHARSGRTGPCVILRCDTGEDPLEDDLPGDRLAAAAGGTLVLREVGALPPAAQARLVRALQERDARGDRNPARVVATATVDLAEAVAEGLFRSDLYYRLNVFAVAVPSLRERREDLELLCQGLVADAAAARGDDPPPALSPAALAAIAAHPFHGNVRELRETLARAVARARGEPLQPAHLGLPAAAPAVAFPPELPLDLAQLERLAIEEALRRVDGNRTQAARLLNIGLRTLRNKLAAWRAAGEIVPSPRGRQELPAPAAPAAGAPGTAEILARVWARRSQERRA